MAFGAVGSQAQRAAACEADEVRRHARSTGNGVVEDMAVSAVVRSAVHTLVDTPCLDDSYGDVAQRDDSRNAESPCR